MTTPPKHYTTDTLVKFMDNPFAKDEEIEDEDTMYANIRKGATIGKTSTRAEIINKAQKSGYISLKKDIYRIEQKGIFYINSLFKLGIDLSKESTVKMGVLQREDVYKRQISVRSKSRSSILRQQENTKFISLMRYICFPLELSMLY